MPGKRNSATLEYLLHPFTLSPEPPMLDLLVALCLTIAAPQSGQTHIRLDRPMELFWTSTYAGVAYQVQTAGHGPVARVGDEVTIQVVVRDLEETVVHSTRDGAGLVTLTLSPRQVIHGVEAAIVNMRAGEHRRLLVPTSLDPRVLDPAAGRPTTMMIYDVELVGVQHTATAAPSGH